MKHSIEKYLEDVRLSILDIQRYVKDVTSDDELSANQLLFDALCRRFSIIGEAIYQADKLYLTVNITDKDKIKGLRHVIVHDYDTVKPENLWRIIQDKRPLLQTEVEELLNRLD